MLRYLPRGSLQKLHRTDHYSVPMRKDRNQDQLQSKALPKTHLAEENDLLED